MSQFKVGDTVRLKSGGPVMTIVAIGQYRGSEKAECQWFDGSKLVKETFPPDSLTIDAGPQIAED